MVIVQVLGLDSLYKSENRERHLARMGLAFANQGRADVMKPAIDWKEMFKQWGYKPCKN